MSFILETKPIVIFTLPQPELSQSPIQNLKLFIRLIHSIVSLSLNLLMVSRSSILNPQSHTTIRRIIFQNSGFKNKIRMLCLVSICVDSSWWEPEPRSEPEPDRTCIRPQFRECSEPKPGEKAEYNPDLATESYRS